jgi:isoleucyl-tRNA synthetase
VRLSRRRFWKSTQDADKAAAYQTLYDALATLVKLLAPILPFLSETIYQALVRPAVPDAPESVHLADWPVAHEDLICPALEDQMKAVMTVARLGLAARKEAGVKVRQPLGNLRVFVPTPLARKGVERFRDVLLRELNVKALNCVDVPREIRRYVLKPDFAGLGRKHGALTPAIAAGILALDADAVVAALRRRESMELQVADTRVAIGPDDVIIETEGLDGRQVAEDAGYVVGLDMTMTEELREEGLARDLVRHIQNLRKDLGLAVQDRIVVRVCGAGPLSDSLSRHRDYIVRETLADELVMFEGGGSGQAAFEVGGQTLEVEIHRVAEPQ